MPARSFVRTVTFSRPVGNTTQYSVGDAVSDNATNATSATFVLPQMAAVEGLGGVIHSVVLHKDDEDLVGADFDIYFFDTQPVNTGYEDNVAIAITDAEWKRCQGFVFLSGATAPLDARSVVTGDLYNKTNLDIPYQCAGGSRNLYFVMVARGTYTPADGETFTLSVGGVVQ